jgi:signal peptidase I
MFKKIKTKFKELPPIVRALIKFGTKLIIIASICLILFNYIIGIGIIHDNMNYPSLKDGDLTLVYRLSDYNIGDMIKYYHEDKIYFGRIVAVEGDVVEITEEKYLVNGISPYEPVRNLTLPAENSNITYPYVVKSGEVFILVDYRQDGAQDSRNFGGISLDNVEGKLIFVFRSRGI